MNDLLSNFQSSLLDMIFMGDSKNRGKYNMIIAEAIEPFLSAEEYMDRSDNENELKQVIGDIHACYDIGEDGVMITGRDGMIIAGVNAKDYEKIFTAYLSLLTREVFVRYFFVRTFVLDDLLKKIRKLILNYTENPNHIESIRQMLNAGSRDVILLKEVLAYLTESLEAFKLPPKPTDSVGMTLYSLLAVEDLKHDVELRVNDLEKLVHGAHNELNNLQQMTDVINTKQLEDVFKNVEANTKYLVDASAATERSSASLMVMQIILAGSFAFGILDRMSGGTLNIKVPDWINKGLKETVIDVPFLWFALNICWFLLVSYCLYSVMTKLANMSNGAMSFRKKLNQKIRRDNLNKFLKQRFIEVTDCVREEGCPFRRYNGRRQTKSCGKAKRPKSSLQLI